MAVYGLELAVNPELDAVFAFLRGAVGEMACTQKVARHTCKSATSTSSTLLISERDGSRRPGRTASKVVYLFLKAM
jgi:hypothetical protein